LDNIDLKSEIRRVSRDYISSLNNYTSNYLSAVDQTGLGSFSFDSLFSKINDDPILSSGPGRVKDMEHEGFYHLVDAIKDLPEMGIAIGYDDNGPMNVEAVAEVVDGWVKGKSVKDLSDHFPGEEDKKIRNAAKYLFSDVSKVISWGTHAYMRGWRVQGEDEDHSPEDLMLGSYIEHGVDTPEAAVASLLGMPRHFAIPFAREYREEHGKMSVEDTKQFREFLESADEDRWEQILDAVALPEDVSAEDAQRVWNKLSGVS
jgi:hypothetical protein